MQPLDLNLLFGIWVERQGFGHERERCERGAQLMGHIADPALLQVLLGLQGLAALQKHPNRAVAPGNGDGLQRFAADRLRMQRGGAHGAVGPAHPLAPIAGARLAHRFFQLVAAHHLQQITALHHLLSADPQQPARAAIEMLQPVGAIEHQKPLGGFLQPVEQLPRTDHRLARPAQPATQRLNHPKR